MLTRIVSHNHPAHPALPFVVAVAVVAIGLVVYFELVVALLEYVDRTVAP